MRAFHLIRDHANTAFAAFCTVAMQIEVWFAGYSPHRPLLSLLALFATVPLAFAAPRIAVAIALVCVAFFLTPQPKPRYKPGQTPSAEEEAND